MDVSISSGILQTIIGRRLTMPDLSSQLMDAPQGGRFWASYAYILRYFPFVLPQRVQFGRAPVGLPGDGGGTVSQFEHSTHW